MILSFIIIFIVVFFSGIGLHAKALIFLPLVMLIEYILALGVTFLTSALTVYFRDLEHILGIISMAWMYLTPILYDVTSVPEEFLPIFNLNPMTPIIVAYRDILYYGKAPQVNTLLNAFILGILVLGIGEVTFAILQRHFVEEL